MRIIKQVVCAGTAAAVVGTLAPTGATAARATATANARVVGDAIQYIAGPADNRIMLSQIDGYYVIDDTVRIVPGPGCYQAPGYNDTIVHCDATRINLIYLSLGPGHDEVGSGTVAPTLKVPLWLVGGPGRDHLYGERGGDRIDAGGDDDVAHGRDGDDKLDGGPGDNLVDGGADWDACTNGPAFRGCEIVS